MYSDSINVNNKIITDKDLEEIFYSMYEELQKCERQNKLEKMQNEKFSLAYQNWTVGNLEGSIKAEIDFYDNTNITIDNFTNFISLFNSRLEEIKRLYVHCKIHYYKKSAEIDYKYYTKVISLYITENSMSITVNMSSEDELMNPVYELIKEKIKNAPEKYDRIIKNRAKIYNKVAFGIGTIPGIILPTLLLFVPSLRYIYGHTYIAYPIISVILSFIIGSILTSNKLNKLYKNIVPRQKYAGFDTVKAESVYKDDIESFMKSSEITIGNNIDNLRNRQQIAEMEEKYSKNIKQDIFIIILLSVIVVILCKII